jgi:hypothetical protein
MHFAASQQLHHVSKSGRPRPTLRDHSTAYHTAPCNLPPASEPGKSPPRRPTNPNHACRHAALTTACLRLTPRDAKTGTRALHAVLFPEYGARRSDHASESNLCPYSYPRGLVRRPFKLSLRVDRFEVEICPWSAAWHGGRGRDRVTPCLRVLCSAFHACPLRRMGEDYRERKPSRHGCSCRGLRGSLITTLVLPSPSRAPVFPFSASTAAFLGFRVYWSLRGRLINRRISLQLVLPGPLFRCLGYLRSSCLASLALFHTHLAHFKSNM